MKPLHQRRIAKSIIAVLVWTQFIGGAYAAPTDISDVPVEVKNRAKPNIMFILDNSGSMGWTEMPDEVWDNGFGPYRAYKSSSFNRIYYNPTVTYQVPVDANGNSLGNSNFFAAWEDGFNHAAGTRNLSTSFRAYSYGGASDPAQPAYYCTYNGGVNVILTSPADNAILSNNANFTCVTVPVAQRQNFANWYSYYRTRMLAMKSAASLAFAPIDDKYRVGFFTINAGTAPNTTGANFRNTLDFNAAHKANWYSTLFSITPNGGTPLQAALDRVGQYYQTGVLPGAAAASIDPIQHSCQSNYAILSTDGYWNTAYAGSGNRDTTVPALPAPVTLDPISNTPITSGSNFPRPFYDANGASNTLADVAMQYWVTDLRPGMANNVPANSRDPATWQHMVTFTLGLGVNGTLPYNATTFANLLSGAINWPIPIANGPTTIDDLWHAAVNGHGEYFSASDPTTLQIGLTNALNNIVGRDGSGAGVAVSTNNLSLTAGVSFTSEYNSGTWTGDLQAYPLDPLTGAPNLSAPLWAQSAQAQLDTRNWTTRVIATFDGTNGIPFTWASLPASMQTRLHTPPAGSDGANVLNFLRGDRSLEGATYRTRAHVLGDAIHAGAVYVGPPNRSFIDDGYAAFKAAQASRTPKVYLGANDGMLHAFNASSGAESWAYVPGALFRMNLSNVATGTSALVNLSSRTAFRHLYYVDATPWTGDADLSNTAGSGSSIPDWRTLLIGGLGKGGRGYYALDITSGATPANDAAVANKVLWEFPNAATPASVLPHIGYSFGRPVLVKTQTQGWVVLVTSGYNNGTDATAGTTGDGQGRLYVLNARTGALIAELNTGVGTAATPSGLAQITPYILNANIDLTTDFVYGGDLLGNVWRFDLRGPVSNWEVKKLATLVDAAGNYQPVTTAPRISEVAGRRIIYVGTGQYLGDSDIAGQPGSNVHAAQTQTMYALWDDLSATPLISPLRANLQQQVLTLNLASGTATVTSNTIDWASKRGWYIDLTQSGERINIDPVFALGTLIFVGNIPSTAPCVPGGSSWLYFVDYATGGVVPGSTLGAGLSLGNTLTVGSLAVQTTGGVSTINTGAGGPGSVTSTNVPIRPVSTAPDRITWQEVFD